jgi:hypothetical protein
MEVQVLFAAERKTVRCKPDGFFINTPQKHKPIKLKPYPENSAFFDEDPSFDGKDIPKEVSA